MNLLGIPISTLYILPAPRAPLHTSPAAHWCCAVPCAGRPEHEQQQRPPWGYGDNFDESKLPPEIRRVGPRCLLPAACCPLGPLIPSAVAPV
jgi:hypothetical protein